MPLRLFRDRSFSVTNIVGFAFSFGTFGAVFILIQYMQVVQGSTPLEAAVQTTPWTLAPMFVAPLAGIIAPRVGTRVLMVAGLGAAGASRCSGSRSRCRPTSTTPQLVAPFIMAGVGMGLVFAPSATALLATLGVHRPREGVGRQLDRPRDRHRARHRRHDRDLRRARAASCTPDLYVDAARPAVLAGAAVLLAAMVAALWLPSGRSSTVAAEIESDAADSASDSPELVRA